MGGTGILGFLWVENADRGFPSDAGVHRESNHPGLGGSSSWSTSCSSSSSLFASYSSSSLSLLSSSESSSGSSSGFPPGPLPGGGPPEFPLLPIG